MLKNQRRGRPGMQDAALLSLAPLTAPDYEYLFGQLLEGVAHGWQQPRVMRFFTLLKQRISRQQWLDWLTEFGDRQLAVPSPSEDLARRLIQLGDLDCGEVTNLAGNYGHQLIQRLYGGYIPELEFSEDVDLAYLPELSPADMGGIELDVNPVAVDLGLDFAHEGDENPAFSASEPIDPLPLEEVTLPEPPGDLPPENWVSEQQLPTFGEVPPELRLPSKRIFTPPQPSVELLSPPPADPAAIVEERQITIEEFAAMIRQDPELLQQISQQLGLENPDPQLVVDTVLAQMQQQMLDNAPPSHEPDPQSL